MSQLTDEECQLLQGVIEDTLKQLGCSGRFILLFQSGDHTAFMGLGDRQQMIEMFRRTVAALENEANIKYERCVPKNEEIKQ